MKHTIAPIAAALVVLCVSLNGRGTPPPRGKTLAERLDLATHVFVGTVKAMRVVKVVDGKVQEVKPEPKTLDPNTAAEIEIEVSEVLVPANYQPKGTTKYTVKYLFGGGQFSVADLRKDTVGEKGKMIFLARPHDKAKGQYFCQSYGWQLSDSYDQKKEICDLLDKRAKKQQEEKKR